MMFSKCEPLSPLNKPKIRPNDKTTLSCYLSNVRFKLNKKKAEYISYWCQANEIDIIFLTETGFDPDRPAYFDIKGYEIISVANKKQALPYGTIHKDVSFGERGVYKNGILGEIFTS